MKKLIAAGFSVLLLLGAVPSEAREQEKVEVVRGLVQELNRVTDVMIVGNESLYLDPETLKVIIRGEEDDMENVEVQDFVTVEYIVRDGRKIAVKVTK